MSRASLALYDPSRHPYATYALLSVGRCSAPFVNLSCGRLFTRGAVQGHQGTRQIDDTNFRRSKAVARARRITVRCRSFQRTLCAPALTSKQGS